MKVYPALICALICSVAGAAIAGAGERARSAVASDHVVHDDGVGSPALERFGLPVDSSVVLCVYDDLDCAAEGQYHTAIDYGASSGLHVKASAAGTVALIVSLDGDDLGFGNCVILEHDLLEGGSVYSLYAHLESVDADLVPGQAVSRGQALGVMGGSGYDSPTYWTTHLHFEIKDTAVLENPSGGGPYWGYTPTSADDYGYHDPELYYGRIAVRP